MTPHPIPRKPPYYARRDLNPASETLENAAFLKTAEKVDAHSDARSDSMGAKTDADSTPADSPVTVTGLATIASAWVKLATPIRDAILAIVRDEIGAENVTGLAAVATSWMKLSPEVRNALVAIVADALTTSTATEPVAVSTPAETSQAFTRGTVRLADIMGSDN